MLYLLKNYHHIHFISTKAVKKCATGFFLGFPMHLMSHFHFLASSFSPPLSTTRFLTWLIPIIIIKFNKPRSNFSLLPTMKEGRSKKWYLFVCQSFSEKYSVNNRPSFHSNSFLTSFFLQHFFLLSLSFFLAHYTDIVALRKKNNTILLIVILV